MQSRSVLVHLQRRDKGFLWNVDLAELSHLFLASLLLVQKFAQTTAAVALCIKSILELIESNYS